MGEEIVKKEEEKKNLDEEENEEEEVSEDVNDEEEEEEESDLILGKYETQDDLITALHDSQTRLANTQTELDRIRSGKDTEPVIDQETRTREFAVKVRKDPLTAIEDIIDKRVGKSDSKRQKQDFKTRYNSMTKQNDFKALEPTMAAIAQEYRPLIEDAGIADDPQLLDILYFAAKGVAQDGALQDAETKGTKKGEKLAKRKGKVRIEGAGKKGKTKVNFDNLSSAEMKKRIKADGAR